MTYALAWKSDSEVFLAADTALTTISREEPLVLDLPESSFGQKHILTDGQKRKIEERVVKLFLREKVGITFAGNYDLAINIVKTFYEKFEGGLPLKKSLEEAIFLNSPFPKDSTVQLAIGYYDKVPKIISFNADYDLKVREDEHLVQMGKPLKVHGELTESWIRDIILETVGKPELHLSSVLGILQSYNLFSPQMERGVGGAFCGLYINKNGAKWQPDILFIEYKGKREKCVSTCFRHDCLVINSPVIGQSRCFWTYLPQLSDDFLRMQTAKAIIKGKRLYNRAEFQYIVILNTEKINLTLVEMERERKHRLIWLEPFKDAGGSGMKMCLFPELRKTITRSDGGLVLIPYLKPTIKQISEDKKVERNINYS